VNNWVVALFWVTVLVAWWDNPTAQLVFGLLVFGLAMAVTGMKEVGEKLPGVKTWLETPLSRGKVIMSLTIISIVIYGGSVLYGGTESGTTIDSPYWWLLPVLLVGVVIAEIAERPR
jgi:membrane protease YdiL (CAAX protease family)